MGQKERNMYGFRCTGGATARLTFEYRYMELKDLVRMANERKLPPPAERRRIREAVGLTQDELADVLGVSRAALARWEAGCRKPRRESAASYALALREMSGEVES